MLQKKKSKKSEFGDIPIEWSVKPINQVAEFTRGYSYSGLEKSHFQGDYFFVTLNSVKEGGGFKKEYSYISSGKVKERHFVLANEIVIANTEQTKTGTLLGCPALVLFPPDYKKKNAVYSHHITKIKENSEVNRNFLYYFLIFNQKKAVCYHTGSVIWSLDIPNWSKNEKILLPPIAEQKAIAKILFDLDTKIELNQQMNLTLESIAKALFKHWFVDFEFPHEAGRPYKSSGGKMINTELGDIPDNWEIKSFEEIVEVMGGTTPDTNISEYWNGDIPWITPKDLTSTKKHHFAKTTRYITKAGLESIGNRLVPANSVLLSSRAPIGEVAINDIPMATNQGFVNIIPSQSISSIFLLFWLRFNKERLIAYSNGTTFGELSKKSFKKISIILPPKRLMDKFTEILTAIDTRINLNYATSDSLIEIRDSLLPRLMSGKIRVPV